MKIGLRAGHSDNCIGAVGIVDEHSQMKKYYLSIKEILENYGHTVIDCNSNGYSANAELSEGASKANSNRVDLFVSLHMNASNGAGHGTEALISSTSSGSYPYAKRLCNNFAELGFTNRGVKCERLFEMNHINAPNIIFEICFCDSEVDMDVYNKYSWNQLASYFCNALDANIPKCGSSKYKNGWNQNETGWFYYTDVNNDCYYNNGWQKIDDEWYYFNPDGYAKCNSWIQYKDKWYWMKDSCKMARKEWIWVGGKCYCFNDAGELYINCKTPDGYKVDAKGAWIK